MNLPRYLRTLRHVRPSQLGWRVIAKARHAVRRLSAPSWPPLSDATLTELAPAHSVAPAELPEQLSTMAARWRSGVIEYHAIARDRHDWAAAGTPRLWRYERHYHTELVALAASAHATPHAGWDEEATELVRSWVRACPPGTADAWEPYPIARRTLSWSVAAFLRPDLGRALAPYLAVQLEMLAANLEWDVLGNHLLCDASALLAGGTVLGSPAGARAAARGEALLARELRRQVLEDGGLAERTVQYHGLVLRDVLLAMALRRASGREQSASIAASARAMAAWLEAVTATGRVPFLNDAAPDATPSTPDTLGLAAALGLRSGGRTGWLARAFTGSAGGDSSVAQPADVQLGSTGWIFVRQDRHELLFDHGPIGPDEQPGHGHGDALAYELVWDGALLVSDSGVTTYEANAVRDFERSSRAHSTVAVDGAGADEPWSAFRVGGRAKTTGRLDHVGGAARVLRGRARAFSGWIHDRTIIFVPGIVLIVDDVVLGAEDRDVVSRITLDPAFAFDKGGGLVGPGMRLRLTILDGELRAAKEGVSEPLEGWVGRGFGQRVPRVSLVVSAGAASRIAYALGAPDARVERAAEAWVVVAAAGRWVVPVDRAGARR